MIDKNNLCKIFKKRIEIDFTNPCICIEIFIKLFNQICQKEEIKNEMKYIQQRLNPLNSKLYQYDGFIKLADTMNCKIPWSMIQNKGKRFLFDFTKQSQKLFTHNGQMYYGDQSTIYNYIIVFNDLVLNEEVPELTAALPRYLLSLYLQSCYQGYFCMSDIDSNDFIQFLHFIDQYPTINLSIELLEKDIVQYMLKHNIVIDPWIREVCKRYRLKYLYLMINEKFYLK